MSGNSFFSSFLLQRFRLPTITDSGCKRIHTVAHTPPHFVRTREFFSHMCLAQSHCLSLNNGSYFHLTSMSLRLSQQSTPSPTPCTSPTNLMPTLHSEETRAPLQVRSIGPVADIDAPTLQPYGGRPLPKQLARVGSPTKTFHEEEKTVLMDEGSGGVGPAAKGGGNIQNITSLTNQRRGN